MSMGTEKKCFLIEHEQNKHTVPNNVYSKTSSIKWDPRFKSDHVL